MLAVTSTGAPSLSSDSATANDTTAKRSSQQKANEVLAMNVGVVARETSLSQFEAAARRPEVKGAILYRGRHELEDTMGQWVAGQEEPMDCFAMEQVVLDPRAGSDRLNACSRLAARLPVAFREVVRGDAEALSTMLLRCCGPTAPSACLTVQLEIVGHNSCTRWHEDKGTVGRMVVTYSGPGTWMVDDASVQFDQFAATRHEQHQVSDPRIVPSFASIHQAPANAIALVKGRHWPGIVGNGLIHKSPNLPYANGQPALKRLLLKVDLSN
jgi:hypothetical protein